MNGQKGVSMLEVVVAIIILLMIAFFAVFNSLDTIPQAKATEVYTEMKSVQAAVESVKMNLAILNDYELTVNHHYDETTAETNYFIIYGSFDHENTNAAKYLGISDLKRDYIVNYQNGDFRLRTPVNIQGNQVSTFREVNSLINSGVK